MAEPDPRVLEWVNRERAHAGFPDALERLPRGVPTDGHRCVLARAFDSRVTCDGLSLWFERGLVEDPNDEEVRLPEYVGDFIGRFDHGEYPDLIEAV